MLGGDAFADASRWVLSGSEPQVKRLGAPGFVSVCGPEAFPILLGTVHQPPADGDWASQDPLPIAAGCYFGAGRVIGIAHEAYMKEEPRSAFMNRCIQWVAGGTAVPPPTVENRVAQGHVTLWTDNNAFQGGIEALRSFVWGGGGAVVGCCPWGWCCLNPGKHVSEMPMNTQFLSGCGMHLSEGVSYSILPGAATTPRLLLNAVACPETLQRVAAALSATPQERQLPRIRAHLVAASAPLDQACLAYGEQGWWCQTGEHMWAEFDLGETRVLSSLSLWCVNVGLSPKRVRVLVSSATAAGPSLPTPSGCHGGACGVAAPQQPQRGYFPPPATFGVVIDQPFVTCNDPTNPSQNKSVKMPFFAPTSGRFVRFELYGVHNGHCVGVNGVWFHETVPTPPPTAALARYLECCDAPRGPAVNSARIAGMCFSSGLVKQSDMAEPTREAPVAAGGNRGLASVVARLYSNVPCAAVFPGPVPLAAAAISQRFSLSEHPGNGWVSTHTYAKPGVPVAASLSGGTGKYAKWSLQIGCHSDKLQAVKEDWRRWPDLVVRAAFDDRDGRATVTSPFGGLVFLSHAGNAPDVVSAGPTPLCCEVSGAVAAPRASREVGGFVDAEAPWGEAEGQLISFCVPRAVMKKWGAAIPAALDFWDAVVASHHRLATPPYGRRRERVVVDEQLNCGYMHSGYPLMAHMDFADRVFDLPLLQKKGDWGMFHECGHNMQRAWWTWTGTTEVTVNLFTLWTMKNVVGLQKASDNDLMRDVPKAVAKFAQNGRRYSEWCADPFVALTLYVQLIEAFGWDALQRVFANYEAAPPEAKTVENEFGIIDEWVLRFSSVVGRSIAPFMVEWGLPVSSRVQEQLAGLPPFHAPL